MEEFFTLRVGDDIYNFRKIKWMIYAPGLFLNFLLYKEKVFLY